MQKNRTENMCRVCLTEQEILLNLFDEVEDFQTKLCDLLEYCGDLKVDFTDNYSKLICGNCTSELLVAAKFREKCNRTREILSQFIPTVEESICDDSNDEDVEDNNLNDTENDDPLTSSLIEKSDNVDINDIQTSSSLSSSSSSEQQQEIIENNNKEKIECFISETIPQKDIKKEQEDEEDQDVATIINRNEEEENQNDLNSEINAISTNNVFEHVEFLDTNDNDTGGDDDGGVDDGHYIVFDTNIESNDDEKEAILDSDTMIATTPVRTMLNENIPYINQYIKVENHEQDLYERIISAAKSAAKFSPKHNILTKPHVINYKCDICGAGFTHHSNLRRHLQKHNIWKIFNCSICSYPFSNCENLQEHEKEHSERDSIINENNCLVVEKHDNRKRELQFMEEETPPSRAKKKNYTDKFITLTIATDLNDVKDNKRNHKCNHCEKRFVSKSSLNAHMRIHTGDRPFACQECPKKFTTQGGLVLHTRRHSGHRPFSCNVCSKRFAESSNLKVHMRIHTGEKPHKCTVCGRSFARVFLLQIHQRTHTGERPYQCTFCDKAFAQQGDLASHKRIHTGERPHKCLYCSKGFIKSSALTQHMRKHLKFQKIAGNNEGNNCKNNSRNAMNAIERQNQEEIHHQQQQDDGADPVLQNFDILIVEDETMESMIDESNDDDIIKDGNDKDGEDVIIECASEILDSN